MSALDRLQKNAVSGVANANPAKVAKVDTKTPKTLAELATLAVATSQTSKIENSQSSDAIKTAPLATGTTWRPENPFWLRDHVLDGTLDECYLAYWRAVRYVGSGHTVERSLQFTIADIRRERKARGHIPNLWLRVAP